MEDSVKKVIDSLIEQAKTEAETLAEQMELRQIPSECPLSVLGVVFEGIDAIKDYWRNQTDRAGGRQKS